MLTGLFYDARRWFFDAVLGPEDEWEYKYSTTPPPPTAKQRESRTGSTGSGQQSGAKIVE